MADKTPNIARLTKAYEFFKTLPAKQVDMDDIVDTCDIENNNCGTIACGMGWLAVAKPLRDVRLEWQPSGDLVKGEWRSQGLYIRGKAIGYQQAAMRIFSIDADTAKYLFGPTPDADRDTTYPREYDHRKVVDYKGMKRRTKLNHKSELLARMETVLAYNGVRV